MQITRIAAAVAVAVLVASTAFAQKITTEAVAGANLRAYKTFAWIKQPNVADPILKQQIVADINAQLSARGYQLVADAAAADVGVAAHLATKTERTLNTFYDGFGGGWGWRGGFGSSFGSSTTTESTYLEGTLVVDLFDASTKQAVWRGTAEQSLSSNPKRQAANMEKAAQKMFSKFPA